MSALIEEFKREHAKIFDMLNEVRELGLLSREGQTKLMSAKASLLAHLKKEDEKLYPVLRKEAENNVRLKNTLDLFLMDMENVSSVVQRFFDKYSEGVVDEEFPTEFESFFTALYKRIRNEEDALYKEYEGVDR